MRPTCTHVALLARDIEASVAWYRRWAGLEEVHRRVDGAVTVVWLGEPERPDPFVLVLIGVDHADPVEPTSFAHLGYAVSSREEVEAIAEDARRGGVLREGPVDAGGVVGVYCILADPDGNKIEFSFGQSLGEEARRERE